MGATREGAVGNIGRRVGRRAVPAERAGQILDAAVEVFARKGYQRATTKEIATVAGVAEGTIYNYYRGKRELLIAIVSRLAQTLPPLFTQQVSDERERIAAIIRNRFEALERSRPFLQAILHELIVDEELRQEFFRRVMVPILAQGVAFFQQRVATGDFRPVNPRVALPAMIGAVGMNVLATEMAGQINLPAIGPPLAREEVIGELVELILHGIGGTVGPTDGDCAAPGRQGGQEPQPLPPPPPDSAGTARQSKGPRRHRERGLKG